MEHFPNNLTDADHFLVTQNVCQTEMVDDAFITQCLLLLKLRHIDAIRAIISSTSNVVNTQLRNPEG